MGREGKDLYQMARHYDNLRWKFDRNCFSPSPRSRPGSSIWCHFTVSSVVCLRLMIIVSLLSLSLSPFLPSFLSPPSRGLIPNDFPWAKLAYTELPLMFDDMKMKKKALCGDQFRCFTTDASPLLLFSFVFYDGFLASFASPPSPGPLSTRVGGVQCWCFILISHETVWSCFSSFLLSLCARRFLSSRFGRMWVMVYFHSLWAVDGCLLSVSRAEEDFSP